MKIMRKMTKIEDIYPLTIVNMRYKDKIILFQAHNENPVITTAVEDEEVSYDIESWLSEKAGSFGIRYGIGNTVNEALEDFNLKQ